jgi:ParB family transcriptional regulator, chromosome partitioning protein
MAKKSKDAYGALSQTNLLGFDPDDLVIVTDPADPLYDPRAEDPLDEQFILNIKAHGVIQPIAVWKDPENGETKVVFGRRRTRACREANKLRKAEGQPPLQIQAVVKRGTPQMMAAAMVIENENREDDTPLRKAAKMVRLNALGFSDEDVAVMFGLTKQQVRHYMRLLEQPAVVRNAVDAGKITMKMAIDLAKLDPEQQKEKLTEALAAGEGKKGHAKSRSMRKAVSNKPTMRSRSEISDHMGRIVNATVTSGVAHNILLWVLGGEWPEEVTLTK